MRNEQKRGGGDGETIVTHHGRGNDSVIPNSFKALSSYFRIVSSGASNVASTVRSAASAAAAMVERDCESTHNQVHWAGFDKLEDERGITRLVLLLGQGYGFQVWDVEEADNVHNLVSRHDGPVSSMQILPKPMAGKQFIDKFADDRPLLIICADASFSGDGDFQVTPHNGSYHHRPGPLGNSLEPTVVWFYSMASQSHVHQLRFRSIVYLVRCSSRVIAVLQSNQIHCLNAATLERQYTILTNPVVTGYYGSGNIGFGPLALGPRWIAYSGSQVAISNPGRVNPQHLTNSASIPAPASNGSLVAHYAKESGKQLAAGIVTLGDIGYKKLSRYYSELGPDGNNSQSSTSRMKVHDAANGQIQDTDNVGMVVVRDIVSKSLIVQFKAHKSPIQSLCFDPTGTLLVTASIHGHSINVFRIMPIRIIPNRSGESSADSGPSYLHLYKLQRGVTNAIIQDISFSSDSRWIMISSSRGTSHLFAISPSGGSVSFQSSDVYPSTKNNGSGLMTKPGIDGPPYLGLQVLSQQSVGVSGPPVTLNAVSRIRNGNSGWRSTVSAAAAATGRMNVLSGPIVSTFHNCKGNDFFADISSLKRNSYLLVFCPSGCMIQYVLHLSAAVEGMSTSIGASASTDSGLGHDTRLVVEAIQKWNICQKQSHKEREDYIDMQNEHGNSDSRKVFPEGDRQESVVLPNVIQTKTNNKITNEERHHMYISEVELKMHESKNPLWGRSEIIFHSMLANGADIDRGVAYGRYIEVERIPVFMLESRAKDLVPVFDYLRVPESQQGRVPAMYNDSNGQLLHQFSAEESDGGSLTDRSSAGNSTVVATSDDSPQLSRQDILEVPTETSRGSVNTSDTPSANTWLETVHTGENFLTENQLRSVGNKDGLVMNESI